MQLNEIRNEILYEVLEEWGYRVSGREGSGAFASVYRANRRSDGQIFACKVAAGQSAGAILRREAEILAQLEQPFFPKFEEFFSEGEYAVLVMEYVEGCDLDRVLAHGPVAQSEAVRIAAELAKGLKILHGRPGTLLYRDLKPENIRITQEGRVCLLDLGCACRAEEAIYSRAGSRGYAAPEQLDGNGGCGPYSDVYALGRLLHYLLTGENPCLPPYDKQPIRAYDRGLSPLLERLVERCVDEDPQKRPPDMRRILRRLEPFLEQRRTELFLREKLACLQWFAGGRKWRTAYTCQKNICIFPNLQNPSKTNVVL